VRDLERSSQSLESFIYSVSHDLRAPLRALSGYSGALLEDYGGILGEEGRGYAERIVAASEQMTQLIDYLLQLSRLSRAELHLQPVDLGGEAARIAEELQHREPARHVRFAIEKPVQVLADRRLIRTVLQNLLDNAWKFTSGRDDASIEFGTAPSEDAAVCCYVRDNGAGFDPAYAGKLFQPFQRLHAAHDFPGTGTGTGLASVRQIVERHGGRVWAEGAVGAGATFYFTLDGKESA
jgi:light-regulated signal transduction histidine kinase (bacteriophytochrome)